MNDWLVLTAALPTSPSALRVRIWRALKTTGCATLREGVYILPASAASAAELWAIERAIVDGRADAHMLALQARDAAQEQRFRALFDRSAQHAEFARALKEARQTVKTAGEPALRKRLQTLTQQWAALRAIDFFPGRAGARTGEGLAVLRAEIEKRLSPGEPRAARGAIARLAAQDFQRKTWATRRRPWVDRLATAWLIARFIDAAPRFLWLEQPKQCPKTALGFDFEGARFTHTGDLVSFEVMLHAFGFEQDVALKRLGELVHYLDVGGIPVDEAAGVEALVRGLQAQHAEDDALLAAARALFDTLYAALGVAA